MRNWDRRLAACAAFACLATTRRVRADDSRPEPAVRETVEVTSTRLPADPIEIPASLQVVSGAELEERRIRDLPQALALVMGVSVAPGGDGGPASSVPEMMGLREFDAFLLVVDDVPWGGAFNPATATVDLTNVDRIEVLRGAAPVMYGATSFIGVIHVIHRQTTATPGEASGWGGSYDTFGAAGSSALPALGGWTHSLSGGWSSTGYRDDDTSWDRAHVLYRGAIETGVGKFRLDFDTTILDQDPASPHPRVGTSLTTLIPVDANHNPADARQDEDRLHLVFGYSTPAWGGDWTTTLAITHSERHNTKGFLRADFDVPPPTANADGFRQEVEEDDLYFDSHLSKRLNEQFAVVFGVDELFGKGEMEAENFEYHANIDGGSQPSSADQTIDERPELEDERSFAGAYGQMIWTPAPRWRVEAGLRVNFTEEEREGEVEIGGIEQASKEKREDTRLGGSAGVSFRVWEGVPDAIWIFADYRNTFKPAAIDFGPEAEGGILEPEDAVMYEGGVKGVNLDGRLAWEVSGYRMDFDNVVVATQVAGLPALENVGSESFDGIETEASFRVAEHIRAQASYAWHDAKFEDYLADFGGTLQQLSGNRIEMSANHLASAGVLYSPPTGFFGNALVQYVGDRYLNKRNTALADAYTTWSMGLGYRFAKLELRVDGVNLNDCRDPVAESELGDAQYYLLPARTILGTAVYRF